MSVSIPNGPVDISDPNRTNKYRNKETFYKGIIFDSAKECARFIELEKFEEEGLIKSLECQYPLTVVINNKKMFSLVVDFRYYHNQLGDYVYEDVKPYIKKHKKFMTTPLFNLKRKIVEATLGVEITLV